MKIRQLLPSNFFQKSKSKKKKHFGKCKDNLKETNTVTEHFDHAEVLVHSRENSISNLVDLHSDLDTLFETLRSRANRTHATQQTAETELQTLEQSVVTYENIGQFNSLKPRTRIRTNPWIQVPATELCIYQSDSDNKYAEIQNLGSRKESEVVERLVVCNIPEKDDILEAQENLFISKRQRRSAEKNIETHYRWSIISEGDVSIDWECHTFDEDWDNSNLTYTYNAPYENDLDLILEQGMSEADYTRVSIEDLLQEIVYDTDYHKNTTDDDTEMANNEDRSDNSSIISYPMTNANDVTGEGLMQESLDAGYASLTRDGTLSSDDDERIDIDNMNSNLSCREFSPLEEDDKPQEMDFAVGQEAESGERTLPEVKQSLQEKINQLRLEKLVVQNKIKEAQEEEKARIEQRRLLQGKFPAERKLSLFKTLIDLKERLENQTMRIQRSYSAVLTMKRNFSRQKTPVICVSTKITL